MLESWGGGDLAGGDKGGGELDRFGVGPVEIRVAESCVGGD